MSNRSVQWLEDRLPTPESYPSDARGAALSARLGVLLGATFAICFVTGLMSHVLQHPGLLRLPPLPAWGYAASQGLHVTAGIATIPLLAVKLWSVAPKLWQRPLLGSPIRMVERLATLVLVSTAVLEVVTGLFNVAEAYRWIGFGFPSVHYALAWIAIAAILVHVAIHLPQLGTHWATKLSREATGVGRREVFGLALAASAITAVVTAGDKIAVLRPIGVLSQRSGAGPQGLPVNKSAAAARISRPGPDWRLTIVSATGERDYSLDELRALPQTQAHLPIACVEGWNQWADWEGVRLRDLVEPGVAVRVSSPDRGGYGASTVAADAVARDDTLLALRLNDEPLALDHGAPLRLIAAGRPGALQTKWIHRIEALS